MLIRALSHVSGAGVKADMQLPAADHQPQQCKIWLGFPGCCGDRCVLVWERACVCVRAFWCWGDVRSHGRTGTPYASGRQLPVQSSYRKSHFYTHTNTHTQFTASPYAFISTASFQINYSILNRNTMCCSQTVLNCTEVCPWSYWEKCLTYLEISNKWHCTL